MYDPQIEKTLQMFTTITDKHRGQMNWAKVFYTVEVSYRGNQAIYDLVPHLDISFK